MRSMTHDTHGAAAKGRKGERGKGRKTIAFSPLSPFALSLVLFSVPLWFVFFGGTARGGDWPQFRGPGGTAVADEAGLPATWDVKAGTNVRWKADPPGRGVSCPVVAKGKVFLTSCSGYRQDRLHVLCYDAATGAKRWERQFHATGSTNCHPTTSMAGATPVTDGDRVFALFGTGDLAALDADGNLLWYRALVRDYPTITNQVGMAASPVLWNDTLFVPMENAGDESFALAVDARTGVNRWKADRGRDINWVTPLVLPRRDGADVLFVSKDELTAYDADSGSKRWLYRAAGLSSVPSPLPGADGTVLAPGGESAILKPEPENGGAQALWKSPRLRSGYTTPLSYGGHLYAVSGTFLNRVGLADGQAQGTLRLNVKGPFWASPVAADGKIYVGAEDGTVLVVKPGKGMELVATNRLGETLIATPALAEGAIYFRTDGHLYCIAEKRKS